MLLFLPWVAGLLLLGCLLKVWQSYRRLSFIPGPFLAQFTDIWRLHAQNSRGYCATLLDLHRKHGNLVRVGPNHISIGDPNAIPIVYSTNPVWPKASSYQAAVPFSNGKPVPSIIGMTEAQHTATRRAVGRAFTTTSLLDYEAAIEQTAASLISILSKRSTHDITSIFQFFAMDVLVRIAFSESLGLLEKGQDVDGVLEAVMARFDRWNKWASIPFIDRFLNQGPLSWLHSTGSSPLARVGMTRLRARQASDLENRPDQKDLLQKFLDGQEKHSDIFSEVEMLGTIMSTIGAGADTTGGTLSYTFYLLAKYPETKQRLESEINLALASGTLSCPPKWTEVMNLPYLDAVLRESMRYISIAAWGLDRVVPESGATIAGQFIPAGTVVGCQIDAVHRNREVFGENADEFCPERWVDATDLQRKRMERCFLAFSSGKRVCMGVHIAWLELKKIVPLLVMQYDMTLVDPNQDVAGGIRISAVKYAPEIYMNIRKKTAVETNTNEEVAA